MRKVRLIEVFKIKETPIHGDKGIPWSQFKSLEPRAAKILEDFYKESEKRAKQGAKDDLEKRKGGNQDVDIYPPSKRMDKGSGEIRPGVATAQDVLDQFLFRRNPNGSWEAWGTHPNIDTAAIWSEDAGVTGKWFDSDYTFDDEKLDKASGIKNWRDNQRPPSNSPPSSPCGGGGCDIPS